jgi:hypothetical protein
MNIFTKCAKTQKNTVLVTISSLRSIKVTGINAKNSFNL